MGGTEPPKLALLGLDGVNVSAKELTFFTEQLEHDLSARGFHVVSATDITALVGLERQKQLLKCDENAPSCIAEIANALGVDGVVIGQIARFGSRYQVLVKVLANPSTKLLGSYAGKTETEENMADLFDSAAGKLSDEVLLRMGRAAASPPGSASPVGPTGVATQGPGPSHPGAWITAGAGAVILAGGVVLLGLAASNHGTLTGTGTALTEAQAASARDGGNAFQTAGWIAVGAAAVTLAGAGVWGSGVLDAKPQVTLSPIRGGAVASFSIAFP